MPYQSPFSAPNTARLTRSFVVGDKTCGNYTEFETDGTLIANGDATCWEDISAALIASRLDTASGRLAYDYYNGGVKFKANARYPDEPVVIPIQCRHSMLVGDGAVFRPHFHWLQEQTATPNMLLGYKLTNYGVATVFETDWSNYTFLVPSENVWVYASGVLAQITRFAEINISSLTLSASIDLVLFRDTANASGLFAGADPVDSDVTIKYSDGHVIEDMLGSSDEIIK